MANANPTHVAFVNKMRTHAAQAVAALQQAQADATAYTLLGYAPGGTDQITQDDLTPSTTVPAFNNGQNSDLLVADITNAITALSAFTATATANNNAALTSLLKLAR